VVPLRWQPLFGLGGRELPRDVPFRRRARLRGGSERQHPTESREAAIGYTEGERLLFVVHVIRHEETIRIISAREATREERRQYENP
jgi:uncharacterized DUF497 family protein